MGVTVFASGTQAATVTTEHFLSSPTSIGDYELQVDLSNMVAGDYVEIRVYKMVIAAGTARIADTYYFSGAQLADDLIFKTPRWLNGITDANAIRFSLKQAYGTSRSFAWAVLRDDTLAPTTAGRTLDVSAGGEAGVDWANVGSPTTVVGLSGTTVKTATDVETDTANIQTRIPGALVGGRMDSSVGAVAANAIADAGLSTDLDTYQAKVDLIDDDAGATDRYVVAFFKNAQPVLAGITSPTIQVWKAADGTDLIASTALTEIGTTQTFRYNATTTARVASGAGYVAKVTATIDGATRTWVQVIGRDSA